MEVGSLPSLTPYFEFTLLALPLTPILASRGASALLLLPLNNMALEHGLQGTKLYKKANNMVPMRTAELASQTHKTP